MTDEEIFNKIRCYMSSDLHRQLSNRYIDLDSSPPKAFGVAREETEIPGLDVKEGDMISFSFDDSSITIEKRKEELINEKRDFLSSK